MAKLIAFASSAALLFLLLRPGGPNVHRTLDARAMLLEVKGLNELVTVRYTVQNVVGMDEEKSPVGSEKILLLVQAKVLAGVDLSALSPSDVSVTKGRTASLKLGPPRIIEAFLDEKNTKVWDRRITWWTPWVSPSRDLEHNARLQALKDVREAALRMGILDEACRNAQGDIRKVLGAFGIDAVDFR